jgi:hypothetical protein
VDILIFEHCDAECMRKLHEVYKDEKDFRDRFVRPLLTRLGFVAVAELHGKDEFGKDFVFSELTPFGFLRHYAAVVKHKESIQQGGANRECHDILSQVQQAFSVDFQLPDNEVRSRISAVVVFNSGRISDNARKWIRAELHEERYGRNVHILDGERLSQLDIMSNFHQTEQLIPRLIGMRSDIYLTIKVLESINESLPEFNEGRGTFTSALEGFLAAPFFAHKIDPNEVSLLVQECRIAEIVNMRYMMPNSPKGEIRDRDIETLRDVTSKAIQRANKLNEVVKEAMSIFRPLAEFV